MCFTPKQVFTKKYCQVAAAWSEAEPLPAQYQDLLPCCTHHSLGGAKEVASCSAGVHGLPSTLVKEQREKIVLIEILGIYKNLHIAAVYNST